MSERKVQIVLPQEKNVLGVPTDQSVILNLDTNQREINDNEMLRLVDVVARYNQERNSSNVYRLYGNLQLLNGNGITLQTSGTPENWEYKAFYTDDLLIQNPSGFTHNWNLQVCYPAEHTQDIGLSQFRWPTAPFDNKHTIYQGLPFQLTYQTEAASNTYTVLHTFKHEFGANLTPDDYVYLITATGGTISPLYGFHKVLDTVLPDGTLADNVVVLNTDTFDNNYGSYKRVVNVSTDDINFNHNVPCSLNQITTLTAGTYCLSLFQHNVEVGDYVDVREYSGTTFNRFNGLHRVKQVISKYLFVIDTPAFLNQNAGISTLSKPDFKWRYRKLDGTPSHYLARWFRVILPGDFTNTITDIPYDLQPMNMSRTVFGNVTPTQTEWENCGMEAQSGSEADGVCSYIWNMDVDTTQLRDNWGRPVSELLLALIKRKNLVPDRPVPYLYQALQPNWLNNLMVTAQTTSFYYVGSTVPFLPYNAPVFTTTGLQVPQFPYAPVTSSQLWVKINQNLFSNPTIVGPNNGWDTAWAGLSGGTLQYMGDLVDYNVYELGHTVIDDIHWKLKNAIAQEGYVYKPFRRIPIRHFSSQIEYQDDYYEPVPYWHEILNGKNVWRSLNDFGFKDPSATGVNVNDAPFLNGGHYMFNVFCYELRRQSKTSPPQYLTPFGGIC